LTGLFGRKSPSNVVLLLVYGILLKLAFFMHPQAPLLHEGDGLLYRQFIHWIEAPGKQLPFLYSLLSFLLLFLQAISLNRLMNNYRLMNRPNFLPAMAYLLISSFFTDWNRLSSALLVNTILLWVWSQLTRLQNSDRPRIILFNAGLALGLSNLIYSYSFAFMVIVYGALVVYRAFRLNEYLVPFFGFLTPYYFFFVYQYLNDAWNPAQYLLSINFNLPELGQVRWIWAGLAAAGLLTMAGFYLVQQQSGKMLIMARKSWTLLSLFLCISLLIPFVNANFGYWILCLTPVAAFAGAAFLYLPGKKMAFWLHWVLVAFVLAVSYYVWKPV
jgi:hypothetical protein